MLNETFTNDPANISIVKTGTALYAIPVFDYLVIIEYPVILQVPTVFQVFALSYQDRCLIDCSSIYLPLGFFTCACAAASLAIGTRNGEHET